MRISVASESAFTGLFSLERCILLELDSQFLSTTFSQSTSYFFLWIGCAEWRLHKPLWRRIRTYLTVAL